MDAVWRVTDGTEVRRVGCGGPATDARGSAPRANAARRRGRGRRRRAASPPAARAAASAAARPGSWCVRGDPIRPFYERSICALRPPLLPRRQPALRPAIMHLQVPSSFSGRSLLIAVGCDDQHTIGVWDWRRGELLVSRPGLTARPPGIHQLCAAPMGPPTVRAPLPPPPPPPPSYPSPSCTSATGATLLFVSVGPAAAPKFWTLTKAAAPSGGRMGARIQARPVGLVDAPQAKSFSAVAFGGASFAAKSGAPHGIVFLGGALGRVFLFDVPLGGGRDGPAYAPSYLAYVDAHEGAVTALAVTGASLASGGAMAW